VAISTEAAPREDRVPTSQDHTFAPTAGTPERAHEHAHSHPHHAERPSEGQYPIGGTGGGEHRCCTGASGRAPHEKPGDNTDDDR